MLLKKLTTFCETYGMDRHYYIAYSGGLDSAVLLSLCNELTKVRKIKFTVIHVNHQLHPDSSKWVDFARHITSSYQFPFLTYSLEKQRKIGESIEEYARTSRYDIFAQQLESNDILLTAHHEEDQAETVLLQLLRGAGVKGLSAMPELKSLGKGWLGRPLLSCPKLLLTKYAQEKNLSWIEDDSNLNTYFSRNYLRQKVIPLLKSRWPEASNLIARSADNCALAEKALEEYLALLDVSGSAPDTLSIKKCKALSYPTRMLILRRWIIAKTNRPPQRKELSEIQTSIFNSRIDKSPIVLLQNDCAVRRYRDDIHLVKCHVDLPEYVQYEWQLNANCEIKGVGDLCATLEATGDLPPTIERLNVRFLPPSATIAVMGRGRQHSLKKLFQEWGVPPWLRKKTPLLFLADELVGVPGYYWTHVLNKNNEGPRFKISFHDNSKLSYY